MKALALSLIATAAAVAAATPPTALLQSAFIYEQAPFPSAHASTIAETPGGLVSAWFGGTDEGNKDVAIWISRRSQNRWGPPELVADGVQADRVTRHPCWNPVLFAPAPNSLLLFYKVGPSPREWWGMLTRSADHGRSWSTPQRLPDGILGPIRCKPVALPDGSILCGSSTEHDGWRVHLERLTPPLQADGTWSRTPALNERADCGLIQPTILQWPGRSTQILCRSQQGTIYSSLMGNDWKTWTKPSPIALPNPNSGIDAAILRDGRAVLVYNHTAKGRSPLNVAISRDGNEWSPALTLESEPGEFSYPAVIQSADGRIQVTYTWNRKRIKHAVIDPARL